MDTMTKRFVFEKIASSIAEKFNEHGFIYNKTNGRILSIHKEGFDVIIFHIVDYNPIYEIYFSLRTRLDKVEETINKFMHDRMNPKSMPLTETISIRYKELAGSENDFIEVKSDEELEKAVKEIVALIKEDGLLFFENNHHIQKVNKMKKSHILFKPEGNVQFRDIRTIMQSLTLMKLCNDPDFEELCNKYKELYVPFVGEEETGRNAIDDLITYLKQIS